MKQTFLAAIMVFSILSLTGCGHDHGSSPQIFNSSSISDPAFDGDISVNNAGTTSILTQISSQIQSVFAGIDPSTGAEFRAFLDFPLTGPGGVPGNAVIDSASLDIVINSIAPLTGTIPIRIDLIPIQSTLLTLSDYNSTPLASITIPIFQSDFGQHVPVDVTSLMIAAQNLVMPNFRIRILADSISPGLIEINDTTGVNRGNLAPFLSVNYF